MLVISRLQESLLPTKEISTVQHCNWIWYNYKTSKAN
jgi:hypothetical protein